MDMRSLACTILHAARDLLYSVAQEGVEHNYD